ncbi:efflux RND transporter periplasmic adaptor subunit [Thermosediminibacter litoriperuensis]|uniref:HlyD family secretion protein n=1 Tax=Thermosediminibacter litoriperuensis TaxID=291989 RepID=A0A5S5AMD9_9FIRM|nr:efflux RND transporter periplasmic adaptor subunit [Thermosediminibacter litoriperuensis]TYP52500.1 HlyD family secretion protein [Thermosediminibacter litoriperuensis]
MKYKKILVPITIAAVAAASYFFFAGGRQKAASTTPALTARVQRGDLTVSVKASGTIQPYELHELLPRGSGKVVKIYVKAGDRVNKGDPLLVLSNEETDLSLRKAELSVAQQKTTLEEALLALEKTEVRSPDKGLVKEITVRKGESVSKGAVVARLQLSPGKTLVRAPFNGYQIKNIKPGQKAQVLFLDSLFTTEGAVREVEEKGVVQPSGAVFYYATVEIDGDYYIEGQQTLVDVSISTENGTEQSVQSAALEPPELVDVKAEAAGTVEEIYVKENAVVDEGGRLLSLSSEEVNRNVETARRSLEQAQLDYQQKLLQKEQLTYTAPFDGTIVEVNASEGEELIQSGSQENRNPLVIMADYSKMKVVVSVDELDAIRVKPGMPAKVTSDALPGRTWEGTVEHVAEIGTVQNDVSTFDVTVVTEPIEELRAGMTVSVEIIMETKEDTLMVPVSAVRQINGKSFVVLAEKGQSSPQNGNGRQNFKEVKTGISNSEYVEILEGLNEGDLVLLTSGTGRTTGTTQRTQMRPPGMFIGPSGPRR